MSKTFKKQIRAAAQGSGLSSLIPTGEATALQKIRDKVQQKRETGQLGKVGRPKRDDKDNEAAPSAEKGTKPGEMRKTYLVSKLLDDKINGVAYWDRRTVKEVVNEALSTYIATWEKKNGPVKKINK